MNKFAATFAMVLMLLTGLAVGQLYNLSIAQPLTSQAMPDVHAEEVAARYYAAVNTILETGDSSSLRAMLHPSFVDHPATGDDSGTASDLESDLLALHALFPDLRVESSSTIAGGDMVASSLATVGSAQAEVSEIAVEGQLAGPDFELLRVAENMILERWASAALPKPPRVDVLASLDVERLPIERAISLERITFESSSSRTLNIHMGTVIIVESGDIEIHLNAHGEDAPAATPAVPNDGDLLTAADIRMIPAGVPFRLETPPLQAASVLQIRLDALAPDDKAMTRALRQEIAPGVTREVLADGNLLLPHGGSFTLTMYQATLWPQTAIVNHAVAAGELAWVMNGSVHVDVAQGFATLSTSDVPGSRQTGMLQLAAGQGITGYPGAEVAYRAAGQSPATILLITLALTGIHP